MIYVVVGVVVKNNRNRFDSCPCFYFGDRFDRFVWYRLVSIWSVRSVDLIGSISVNSREIWCAMCNRTAITYRDVLTSHTIHMRAIGTHIISSNVQEWCEVKERSEGFSNHCSLLFLFLAQNCTAALTSSTQSIKLKFHTAWCTLALTL